MITKCPKCGSPVIALPKKPRIEGNLELRAFECLSCGYSFEVASRRKQQ